MITHLHIQNFKCLRDVQVDLAPFTILIGPNDSGKSSLLDAVQFLGIVAGQIQGQHENSFQDLVWRKDSSRLLQWSVRGLIGPNEYEYSLDISPYGTAMAERLTWGGQVVLEVDPKQNPPVIRLPQHSYIQAHAPNGHIALASVAQTVGDDPRFRNVLQSLLSTSKYAFDPTALRQPSSLSPDPVLTATGENLASVMDAIGAGPDRSAIINLERVLHEEIPTLRGVALPTRSDGLKSLEFTLSGNGRPFITIPAALASEGALLLTAFLALAYGNTPDILLIEEPENGLHPSRLKLVIDILRKISTGEVGNRPRQVLVTTHSPILLNYARPEEVRIFQRDREGGTRVTPMTKVHDIDKLLQEFAVGELWYLLGEDALLKEQPA